MLTLFTWPMVIISFGMSIALAGCASPQLEVSASEEIPSDSTTESREIAFGSFNLSAQIFGPDWEQRDDLLPDSLSYRAERIGDLCNFDYDIVGEGAVSISSPQLVLFDEGSAEQAVAAFRYSMPQGLTAEGILGTLERELDRCAVSDFSNSTENGVLLSESLEIDVVDRSGPSGLLNELDGNYLAFDYTKVESKSLLNTNNDYTDDDRYESRGRVVVLASTDEILLATSSTRSWENYGTAPSIEKQNTVLVGLLTELSS